MRTSATLSVDPVHLFNGLLVEPGVDEERPGDDGGDPGLVEEMFFQCLRETRFGRLDHPQNSNGFCGVPDGVTVVQGTVVALSVFLSDAGVGQEEGVVDALFHVVEVVFLLQPVEGFEKFSMREENITWKEMRVGDRRSFKNTNLQHYDLYLFHLLSRL